MQKNRVHIKCDAERIKLKKHRTLKFYTNFTVTNQISRDHTYLVTMASRSLQSHIMLPYN